MHVWIVQSGQFCIMQAFIDMVQGSLRRGLMKGTQIGIGTRYMQPMNCVMFIPIMSKFGRFDVQILSVWNINIQMLT